MYEFSGKKTVAILSYYGIKLVDNLLFYGGKIIGRILFPILLIKKIKFYVFQPSYFPEGELKSKFRIFIEQLFYIIKTGEINDYYFLLGFDQTSKNDFKNYIPVLTFAHARNITNQCPLKPEYDPYNYVCLLRDKFLFGAYCNGAGINTPTNIGMVNAGKLFLLKENRFCELDEITNIEFDAVCKREVSYGGGMSRNFIRLKILRKEIYVNDEKSDILTLKQTIGIDRWLIQERITNQAPEIARFHPQSINTVRIVTIRGMTGVNVLCALLRMGTNGGPSDNWSSGGIVTGVNIENGMLEKWGFCKPGFGTKSDRHPDSQIVFEGTRLPYWEEIGQFVRKAHQLFYGLYSIGWDVAVTTDGIMLIEGNDNWGTTIPQLYKGMKSDFNQYFK